MTTTHHSLFMWDDEPAAHATDFPASRRPFAELRVEAGDATVVFVADDLGALRDLVSRMDHALDVEAPRSIATAEQEAADDKRIADHEAAVEYSEPPQGWEP